VSPENYMIITFMKGPRSQIYCPNKKVSEFIGTVGNITLDGWKNTGLQNPPQ